MPKDREVQPQLTEEEAVRLLQDYLLSQLSRGLTMGREIIISPSVPEGVEVVREIDWEAPVLNEAEVASASKMLKEKSYKVLLIKRPL